MYVNSPVLLCSSYSTPPLAPLTDRNKPAVWAATPREAGWIDPRPDHPDYPDRLYTLYSFIHDVDPGSSLTLILQHWSKRLDVESADADSTRGPEITP